MKRILIDVDDVLANFTQYTLDTLTQMGGPTLDPTQLTNWDLMTHIPVEWHSRMLQAWHTQGWCAGLPVIPGAQEAVSVLETMGEVVYVTAPMHDAPHWMWERDRWLRTYFNASGKQICFTEAKHIVRGDILVDDKVSNIISWQQHNPKKKGVLWQRPNNLTASVKYRSSSWEEVISWFE